VWRWGRGGGRACGLEGEGRRRGGRGGSGGGGLWGGRLVGGEVGCAE
jgi:hypothetical protein